MKKEQALNRLTSLENEAKELRKIIGAPDVPKPITERVKTYRDACDVLGITTHDALIETSGSALDKDMISIRAYAKLIIIARALNEGWEPNWDDSNSKYYPWFKMSGFGFSADTWPGAISYHGVGSRLCFKSIALAEYAGKQFESLYKEYLTIQK